jgi:Bacterial protein of unknown function (HtrL_YibB)
MASIFDVVYIFLFMITCVNYFQFKSTLQGVGNQNEDINESFDVKGILAKSKQRNSREIPINQVTIVTAFYNISSKRTYEEYKPWIQHFASLKDNMIIFTSPELVPIMKKYRKSRPNSYIESLPLSKLEILHEFGGMNFWRYQHSLDEEYKIHSPDLYIIWNSKGHFIQRGIDRNPFNSTFFAWVDIGYFRNAGCNNQRMIRYLPTTLSENQVMLLDVRGLVGGVNCVGGGFIGGFKDALSIWISRYFDLLHSHNHSFIGKDQPWMLNTCRRYSGSCMLIKPSPKYGDPWFFMAPYLNGKVSNLSNETYTIA